MPDQDEHHSSYCLIAKHALQRITKRVGRGVDEWGQPRVVAERGDYKVEWETPDDAAKWGQITLYSDGKWTYEDKERGIDGAINRLHSRAWIRTLTKAGMPREFAMMGIFYFQMLMEKGKK